MPRLKRGMGSPAPCGRIQGVGGPPPGIVTHPEPHQRIQGRAAVNQALLATSTRQAAAGRLSLAQGPRPTAASFKLVLCHGLKFGFSISEFPICIVLTASPTRRFSLD
jgi:hypothetical protein